MRTPSFWTILEFSSICQTPCGVESAGEVRTALLSFSAMGRMSGLFKYREKKSLKLFQFSGFSYQPFWSPKRLSAKAVL